jgi:hypothetical protein
MKTEHADLWYGEAHQSRQNATRLARQAERLDRFVDNGLVDGVRADRLESSDSNNDSTSDRDP